MQFRLGLLKGLGVILGGLALFGLCAIRPASADTVVVHVFNFDFGDDGRNHFDPVILTGDTVQWVWDEGRHSSTSAAGLSEFWESDIQDPGFVFEHTFTQSGVFPYYCRVHGVDNGDGTVQGHSGVVTVVDAYGSNGSESSLLTLLKLRWLSTGQQTAGLPAPQELEFTPCCYRRQP